jgi:hypothetical protein
MLPEIAPHRIPTTFRTAPPDGTEVHYLHFAEQIAAVTAGDTVHIVGRASKKISALKFSGAFIVKL